MNKMLLNLARKAARKEPLEVCKDLRNARKDFQNFRKDLRDLLQRFVGSLRDLLWRFVGSLRMLVERIGKNWQLKELLQF